MSGLSNFTTVTISGGGGGGPATDINEVQNIVNLESVDLVDAVTSVGTVSTVTTVGAVTGITNPVAVTLPDAGDPGSPVTNSITSASEKTVLNGTASAVVGVSTPAITGVIVQAPSTNTRDVFIGAVGVTTTTGIQLSPGASVKLAVNNANLIYCIAAFNNQRLRILAE